MTSGSCIYHYILTFTFILIKEWYFSRKQCFRNSLPVVFFHFNPPETLIPLTSKTTLTLFNYLTSLFTYILTRKRNIISTSSTPNMSGSIIRRVDKNINNYNFKKIQRVAKFRFVLFFIHNYFRFMPTVFLRRRNVSVTRFQCLIKFQWETPYLLFKNILTYIIHIQQKLTPVTKHLYVF